MSPERRRPLIAAAVCLVALLALAVLAGAVRPSVPAIGHVDPGRPTTESVRPTGALHALVSSVRVASGSDLTVGLEPAPFALVVMALGWTARLVRRSSPSPVAPLRPHRGTRGPPALVPV